MIGRRALNRATLARQLLLERASLPATEAVEHLGGLQAQAPLAPYLGLWSRLQDFAAAELSGLLEQRRVVRLHLMRHTVHLVSARDALGWRTLFSPLPAADSGSHFGRGLATVDPDALVSEARRLLEEQPRTRAELGRLLAGHWPDADPRVLAYAATHHIPLCQVPPRGVWGRTGPAAWAPVESWLGAPLQPVPVTVVVLRYLGAFGPASVADLQLWSGLSRLREVLDRLPLRTFSGAEGQVLYDLPDAPRPAEDVPAPPRFLPEYDNLLLSYQDRSRIIPHHRPVPLPAGPGAAGGTVLVDGCWQGTWKLRQQSLRIQPFTSLSRADRTALLAEAERLCGFLAPERNRDLVLEDCV